MLRVLIIDNYDSFTYNLYQMAGEIISRARLLDLETGSRVVVVKNDQVGIDEISEFKPTHLILSPGPGDPTKPKYFGICNAVIKKYYQSVPILGVCLGMQGIAAFFGATIEKANSPVHGKTSEIQHIGEGLFSGIPSPAPVMRYHSLVVNAQSIPDCLCVSATTIGEEMIGGEYQKVIMAIHHQEYPVFGVQFHPESFATEFGKRLLENFLLKSLIDSNVESEDNINILEVVD
jgi:anthranilate synthase component II